VGGEIIIVPPDADAETMEDLRARLEATLNDRDPSRLCANRPSGGSRSWLTPCR